MRRSELAGQVVVITGASSGIGRAAALAFARQRCRLVLTSRRRAALEQVAAACEDQGAEALVAPADVTDPKALVAVADAAVARFGRIDVWINNAGAGAMGRFEDTPLSLHRQVIAVSLLGAMHGAHAALRRFRAQGYGILINTVSMGGWAPTPFAASYTAAKFGLRGLSASLRQELFGQDRIRVCAVFPAIVDTPGFAHGANFTGIAVDPGPHLYAPETVARAMVGLARHPRDELAVGWPARAGQIGFALARRSTERMTARAIRKAIAAGDPAPVRVGALLHPDDDARISGGWRARRHRPSAEVIDRLVLGAATLGAATLGGALLLSRLGGDRRRLPTG